jgi:hypothetical protein
VARLQSSRDILINLFENFTFSPFLQYLMPISPILTKEIHGRKGIQICSIMGKTLVQGENETKERKYMVLEGKLGTNQL